MSRTCLFQLNIFHVFFWAGLEPAPTGVDIFWQVWNLPLRAGVDIFWQVWNLPLRRWIYLGRFGTCPYVHVFYKIQLANTHFGLVWNLPLHDQSLPNGQVWNLPLRSRIL